MKNKEQVKQLLQEAVADVMYAEKFCKEYMLKAQKWGLQGEKRRLGYLSVIYHNMGNFFKRSYYDMYVDDLQPQYTQHNIPATQNIQDFLNKVLEYSETMYENLHTTANTLQAENGYPFACVIFDRCKDIAEQIKYYNRKTSEGKAAEWSDAFIQRLMLEQTAVENIHDEYEKKEAEVGYKF